MRRFLLTLGLFGCILNNALAAFDLQVLAKFNTLLPTDTILTQVIPNGSGGFYAAGKVNQDILLCEFNAFGSLLRSTRWDSPLVQNDNLVRLERSNVSGTVSLTIRSTSPSQGRLFMVQFSPALAVNWAKELLVFNTDVAAFTATGRDGFACFALVTGLGVELKIIRPDGTDGATRTLAPANIFTMEACNTSSNRGFILAGRRNSQAYIARVNNATTILYETETTGTADPTNFITKMVVDTDGLVTAAGQGMDVSTQKIAFFKVTSAGVLTRVFGASGQSPISMELTSATLARVLVSKADVSNDVHDLNRDTLAISRSYNREDVRAFASVTGSNALFMGDTLTGTELFSTLDGVSLNSFPNLQAGGMAAITDNLAAGVGPDGSGGSMVTTFNGQTPSSSSLVVTGAVDRTVIDSDIGANGTVAILSQLSRFGKFESTVTLHRADGTLAFAKNLTFGNAAIVPRLVKVMANGTVTAIGNLQIGNSTSTGITRFTATGVVSFSRTYALPSGLRRPLSIGEVSNELLMHGVVNNTTEGIARIRANGDVAFDRAVPSSKLIVSAPLQVLNGGDRFGVMVVRSNNNMDVNLFNATNGTTITQTTFAGPGNWFNAFSGVTPAGDLFIAASEDGDTRLGILSRTNLSTLQSSTIAELVTHAKMGSSGRVVAISDSTTRKIRMLGPNLAQLTETPLEASITRVADVSLDTTNIAYLLAEENPALDVTSIYSAKYLANGARSAVRRLAGTANEIGAVPTIGVWITGAARERTKGIGPFVAKFSF